MSNASLTNPFVGLRAFEESEDYLFFGRSKQVNELLKKFNNSRFLAVIGSSGSGKSSLVKSGLMPAIYSGFMAVGSNWRVALFRPGNDPIGNLTQELSKEGVLYQDTDKAGIPYAPIMESTLRRSAKGLVQVYKQAHLPGTDNLLIVIDQFEELFRFSKYEKEANEGKSDALHFINILLTASQQRECPVYVLLTMRSDFLGDCSQFRGLPEAINDGQYLVPRMTRDEIREAITGPVAVSTATITQRLVTRLLNDIGNNPDQLPILQHAMMRTWDTWHIKTERDAPIDFEDYDKIGGMKAALSLHAEEAYAELTSDKQRLICELMFKALTDKAADVRGTRRPTSVADLCTLTKTSKEEVIAVAEIFRMPGRTFLMPPPDVALNEKSIIDISHESIMRVWQRLIKWTEEEALSAEIYLRLSEAAKLYDEGKTDLWRNPELEIGLKWYRVNTPNAIWASRYNIYFEKSIAFLLKSEEEAIALIKEKQRNSRNKKRMAIGAIITLALVAIGAFIGLGVINVEKKKADKAKVEADSSYARAERDRQSAVRLQIIADTSRAIAERANGVAILAQQRDSVSAKKATDALGEAVIARDHEMIAKENAERLRDSAIVQNKRIAQSEYLRLIREGPTDKSIIQKENFDYRLIAYCNYLDSLQAEKKNDELYEKLYYCFASRGKENFIIHKTDSINADIFLQDYSLDNNLKIRISNDRLKLIVSHDNETDSITVSDKNKLVAIKTDVNDKLIICSTEDNVISVFNFDNGNKIPSKETIPIGSLATAIDYNNDGNVIYFGLKNGEVGYILYRKDSKNQPIYENALGSRITAVDFFSDNNGNYNLLAASIKGKAIVYQLGTSKDSTSKYLVPDKKLIGNVLPKNIGDILSAKYDPSSNHIQLTTSRKNSAVTKDIYEWNPFVNELLIKFKAISQDHALLEKIMKDCKYYQDR